MIVADRDDAGLRHALDVEDALKDVAATTTLAMAPVGKDAADWLYNGGDPDEWIQFHSESLIGENLSRQRGPISCWSWSRAWTHGVRADSVPCLSNRS